MLFCKNLTKSFGTQTLFSQADFQLNAGERIGIVGRNGSGKSTLFRLILQSDSPDEGEISFPENYHIAGLDQHLQFTQSSVLKEVLQSLPPDQEHDHWKAEKLLSGLGFSQADFQRVPSQFSGGFQIRIKLAQLLLSEPNLLLLDEPTNYLDILTIRWLEKFLKSWKGELICISHDQKFLENIATHTVCIHRQKFKKIKGPPKKVYDQIQREEILHEKTRINQKKENNKQEKFIREFRSGARSAGLVQSRIKMLAKKEKLQALPQIPPIRFQFMEAEFTGAKITDTHNLSFGYKKEEDLLQKLSFEIFPGDKIGIIGANGKGKSTLLKILNQEIPVHSGTLKIHQNVHVGYMGQSNIDKLDPGKNILEELQSMPEIKEPLARSIAGNLLFSGNLAYKPIEVLSGGEKSRVNLGKVLLSPTNLLLLDEPTNHLDYESIEAFIHSIEHFSGAVVFVSHNESFLQKIAEKLIVFDETGVFYYPHNYETFLAQKGFEKEQDTDRLKSKSILKKNNISTEKKSETKIKEKEKLKILKPLKRKIDRVEKEIKKLETAQKENIQQFKIAEKQGNRIKMETLGIAYQDLQKEIEEHWEIWTEVGETIQKIEIENAP